MLVLSLVHKIHFRWYTKLVSSFIVTFLKDANMFVILIMIFFVKKDGVLVSEHFVTGFLSLHIFILSY